MTVTPVLKKKENMDYDRGMPSNDAPMPPGNANPNQIPDHTHPEYDQLLVKIQEIENALQGMSMGGVNQEGLETGAPEDDAGKPKGGQQPIEDNQGNQEPKLIEMIRKVVKEELTGEPERDTGKQLDASGPDNTQNIPQSTQPANGEAPSGGGFDSDDKTNKEDGDETVAKAKKPAEFDKLPIQKNKMEMAQKLIEQAKALMKEANEPDPSEPNPGAVEKEPEPMDGQVANKSPVGGTEDLGAGGASEDPEANVPNDQRPKMKEGEGANEDEDEEDSDKMVEKVLGNLRKEVLRERKGKRESFVGLTALSSEQTQANHEEFASNKQRVTNSIREYLTKAGHGRALGIMNPQIT